MTAKVYRDPPGAELTFVVAPNLRRAHDWIATQDYIAEHSFITITADRRELRGYAGPARLVVLEDSPRAVVEAVCRDVDRLNMATLTPKVPSLETATGKDLDDLAAVVGFTRKSYGWIDGSPLGEPATESLESDAELRERIKAEIEAGARPSKERPRFDKAKEAWERMMAERSAEDAPWHDAATARETRIDTALAEPFRPGHKRKAKPRGKRTPRSGKLKSPYKRAQRIIHQTIAEATGTYVSSGDVKVTTDLLDVVRSAVTGALGRMLATHGVTHPLPRVLVEADPHTHRLRVTLPESGFDDLAQALADYLP